MHNHNQEITSCRNLFRLVDGRRVWMSSPPPDRLQEMLQQDREAREWPHRRLVYVINSPKGFLIDLWDGTPRWSCVAQTAVENGMAWLDLAVARQKCKDCQMVLPHILLSLALVELHKEGGVWSPVHQQGVET